MNKARMFFSLSRRATRKSSVHAVATGNSGRGQALMRGAKDMHCQSKKTLSRLRQASLGGTDE